MNIKNKDKIHSCTYSCTVTNNCLGLTERPGLKTGILRVGEVGRKQRAFMANKNNHKIQITIKGS